MIDAVFDCMVYLQAATSHQGPSFTCLSLVESNQVRLFVSPPILLEVRDVLTRPKIRVKFPHLTPERADLFLQKLVSISVLISDVPDSGVTLRDPGDSPYLNLAMATNAAYLVSRDSDLLHLMQDPAIRSRFPRLAIIDPVEFLNVELKHKSP